MNNNKQQHLSVILTISFLTLFLLIMSVQQSIVIAAPDVIADPRTYDGTDNNQPNSNYGSVGSELGRIAPANYADGIGTLRTGPNPRTISNAIADQSTSILDGRLSDMFWLWGQFLDHDIDRTLIDSGEFANITIPAGDPDLTSPFIPFQRSGYINGTVTTREHLNDISTWIDGSQIYGSDLGRGNWKRDILAGGQPSAKLKMSAGDLLPFEMSASDCHEAGPNCFAAGDGRVNENSLLTAIHTLFAREHNRIIDIVQPCLQTRGFAEIG